MKDTIPVTKGQIEDLIALWFKHFEKTAVGFTDRERTLIGCAMRCAYRCAHEAAALLNAPAVEPAKPNDWAAMLHYPQCWDTAAYPTLDDAIHEALAWSGCSTCKEAQPQVQEPPAGWMPDALRRAGFKDQQ